MNNRLIEGSRKLTEKLKKLKFSTVSHVYLPTDYAREPYEMYLNRYAAGKKRVLFLGMNPGPWGMVQSGVPFGEIAMARDWLKITGKVGKPNPEHPKRPVLGYACERSEVSGHRLWGLFSKHYPKAEDFFQNFSVMNYCPLVWMSETGANITPNKIPKAEREPVEKACHEFLELVIEEAQPEYLIGIGGYAEKKILEAVKDYKQPVKVGRILHPSPASPLANRGWAEAAEKQLTEMGIKL